MSNSSFKGFSFASWGNDLYTGRKNYKIVQARKKFYFASGILLALCLLVIFIRGFNLGIDFTGGTLFQIQSTTNTSQQIATDALKQVLPDESALVSNVGATGIKVQTVNLSEADSIKARDALAKAYDVQTDEVSITSIGPTWGNDVFWAAIRGLGIFLLLAAIFMTIYFRNWRMAVSGVAALFHDMIVTVGVYALVGWEITPATMIGFLTVIGYSMYDTVVVFDKVRENTANLLNQTRTTYEEQANLAVNQTMVRSINTTVVALLPVGSVLFIGAFIMGAGSLRDIALALFVGMIAGAYSSIFLATPMEVTFTNRDKKIFAHTEQVLAKRAKTAQELNVDINDAQVTAYYAPGQMLPGHHQGQRVVRKPRKKRR
ncbi:MAG: protein translocase subunit SecF [Bifidobacteriaceae bacterium]|jgi:preprotein translocase subunit SecF|nr:protein translocase subunit SecF [Bifidobacteriaceae bacterium]